MCITNILTQKNIKAIKSCINLLRQPFWTVKRSSREPSFLVIPKAPKKERAAIPKNLASRGKLGIGIQKKTINNSTPTIRHPRFSIFSFNTPIISILPTSRLAQCNLVGYELLTLDVLDLHSNAKVGVEEFLSIAYLHAGLDLEAIGR